MPQIHGFDYFELNFDRNGAPEKAAEYAALEGFVTQHAATDVIFIAHGFRNNELEATDLYTRFLDTFRANISRPELAPDFATRRIAVAGVYWPSKSFNEGASGDGSVASAADDPMDGARAGLLSLREEFDSPGARKAIDDALALLPRLEGDTQAQDEFVDKLLSVFPSDDGDPDEGLSRILAQPGHELLQKLRAPIVLPVSKDGDDEGGIASVSSPGVDDEGAVQGIGGIFGKIGGSVGKLLNASTWYVMKDRSGLVGANGLQQAVRKLRAAAPNARVHLVGHSLGARLVTSCAKALTSVPRCDIATLTLLQGAFSHYGFAADNGHGSRGFFREVIEKGVVKGPILATHSRRDSVVGYAYSVSSRLAGDNVRAVGDANDQYGGIGRNGTQRTAEKADHMLLPAGSAYGFVLGKVNNVNGDDIIMDHSDVKGPQVTWAFAKSLAAAR